VSGGFRPAVLRRLWVCRAWRHGLTAAFPDGRWFRASRACVSRTGPPFGPAALGGAAGVLDAPAGEPTMAGQGKGRNSWAGVMALWVPHSPAVRRGRPAGCRHPFGCAPAWPAGGHGAVRVRGRAGADHKLVRAAAPAIGDGGGGGQTTSRPRARPGRQLMLPGGRRGGRARRAWRSRPG